ncbi:hypothetical protein TYRP_018316 [Tyrophagus putrescentiae]|nr:hypothetical protein TYRP_018316 [Tyrophagus putrescentiae]
MFLNYTTLKNSISESSEDQSKLTITVKFEALARLAKLIPTVCPNVNRVCNPIFGRLKKCPVEVAKLLRKVDNIATEELKKAGYESVLSAMPIILILIHFLNTVFDIFKKFFLF